MSTITLSEKGTKFERKTDISACINARDYKGFGEQGMTGVIEWKR